MQTSAAASAREGSTCPVAPVTVLVVDDDAAFRYICARAFSRGAAGTYRVLDAETAEQAIEILQTEPVEGLVIDYGLPGMNGASLMHEVRDMPHHQNTAIVAMTAGGSEEVAAELLRAGASDYITKRSINPTSLCRAMHNALEQARLRDAVRTRADALELANAELRRRNDEIARFYHTISHETKTPLTAALLFLSLLEQEVVGPLNEDQRDLVQQVTASCNELVRHVDALIDSTRLECGRLSLEIAEGALRPVIERAAASIAEAAAARQIEVSIDIADALPRLPMDSGRIVQVLANLLGNAVKFTPAGGRVGLTAKRVDRHPANPGAGECVLIEIRDTGIGIDDDDLSRVFDRLYQVGEKGDASAGAGLGLGLTIARDLVRLHGGTIDVTSAVGIGTTFVITLPVSTAIQRGEPQS